MPVRFSVFIPVYNDARWLGGAIESVLAQSHPDWELVIGDNASEEDIAAIAAEYVDDRIRFHRWSQHVDLAGSHNRTVVLCRYEWIVLLSADDRLYPEALATMASRIESLAADGTAPAMVVGPCSPVDEDGKPATFGFSGSWRVKHLNDGLYDGRAWLHEVASPGQVPWNVGSLAVSRDVTDVMGGFFREEYGLSMDVEMVLRAGAHGPVAYIDEPLTYYTVRPDAVNKGLAAKDRATFRMPALGRALQAGIAVHEVRREVGDDERRYVRQMIAKGFVGRGLQHRYVPGGQGRRGAIANLARAYLYDPIWWLDGREAVRGFTALFAPSWVVKRLKARLRARGKTF